MKMDPRLKAFRETGAPPASLYMGLGWDEIPSNLADENLVSARGNKLIKKADFYTYVG
jgi:hypothetical protein